MNQYTKSKPKVQDYNPLTHTSFYNQKLTYSTPLIYSKYGTPPQPLSPEKDYRPMERSMSKNIFATSGSIISRAVSMDNINANSAMYSKTRPRNKVTDPISGEVKVFNIQRPKIESLNVGASSPLDRISSDFNYGSIREFKKHMLKPNASVTGSLRKGVPDVAYVDPFVLKTSLRQY